MVYSRAGYGSYGYGYGNRSLLVGGVRSFFIWPLYGAVILFYFFILLVWYALVRPLWRLFVRLASADADRRRAERIPPQQPPTPIPARPTKPPRPLDESGLPAHPVANDEWRAYSRDLLDDEPPSD